MRSSVGCGSPGVPQRKRSKRTEDAAEGDVDVDSSFNEIDVEADSSDVVMPSTSSQQRTTGDDVVGDLVECKIEPPSSVTHPTPPYSLRSAKRIAAAAAAAAESGLAAKVTRLPPLSSRKLKSLPPEFPFNFTRNNTLFPFHVYYEIIRRAQKDRSMISTEHPRLRPPGGSVIVYDCGGGMEKSRALHNDGYRWSRSKGAKVLQSLENKVVRSYYFLYNPFSAIGNPVFMKYRFHLKCDPYGLVVFHYIGDDKQAAAISERWMKKNSPFPPPSASECESRGGEESFDLQLEAVVEPSEGSSQEDKDKFRADVVANALDLQRQLLYDDGQPFVDRLMAIEDGATSSGHDGAVVGPVVLVCHPLMDEMVAVATFLQQTCPFRSVLLFFHTEFCSPDYHLSTLSFLHPFFEGDQVVPVAFMLMSSSSTTQRDEQDFFFSTIFTKFEDLVNGRFVVVTGQGHAYSPEAFPVAEHVRCWADLKRASLNFLETQLNVRESEEICDYANDIDTLMRCENESIFMETWAGFASLKRYSERPEILAYFENVWSEFKYSSSIWRLKLVGVFQAEDGVTWRGSVSLGNVVMQLCDNNAQLDTIILSLFLLANGYRRHIMAGLHQSGAWRLKKHYKERFQQSHLKIPKLPFAPLMENIASTAFVLCHRSFKGDQLAFSSGISSYAETPNGVFASSSDSCFDDDGSARGSLRNSVRLVSVMTFIVRGPDGLPHVVEAKQRDECAPLLWYCSCAKARRCKHVDDVILKISE